MKKALKYLIFSTLVTLTFALPQIIHSNEETVSTGAEEADALWDKWLNAKLVFRPDGKTDDRRIDFKIGDLVKPESSPISLEQCDDANRFLSISTGCRTEKKWANRDLIEIWIDPLFIYQQEEGQKPKAPVAIYWNKGNWEVEQDMGDCKEIPYAEQITGYNLDEMWRSSTGHSKVMSYSKSALYCGHYSNFTFEW